ncbi:unnamed protein product [Amoebophrya sp. A25]|nr:unnamed protein product [Amoebophrya sp. A25]|eukprot:GSA25T00014372001.1
MPSNSRRRRRLSRRSWLLRKRRGLVALLGVHTANVAADAPNRLRRERPRRRADANTDREVGEDDLKEDQAYHVTVDGAAQEFEDEEGQHDSAVDNGAQRDRSIADPVSFSERATSDELGPRRGRRHSSHRGRRKKRKRRSTQDVEHWRSDHERHPAQRVSAGAENGSDVGNNELVFQDEDKNYDGFEDGEDAEFLSDDGSGNEEQGREGVEGDIASSHADERILDRASNETDDHSNAIASSHHYRSHAASGTPGVGTSVLQQDATPEYTSSSAAKTKIEHVPNMVGHRHHAPRSRRRSTVATESSSKTISGRAAREFIQQHDETHLFEEGNRDVDNDHAVANKDSSDSRSHSRATAAEIRSQLHKEVQPAYLREEESSGTGIHQQPHQHLLHQSGKESVLQQKRKVPSDFGKVVYTVEDHELLMAKYIEEATEKKFLMRYMKPVPSSESTITTFPLYMLIPSAGDEFWSPLAQEFVFQMAQRGFVAAEIGYDRSWAQWDASDVCKAELRAADLFVEKEGSALSTLCAMTSFVDCSKGVAVHGIGQGAYMTHWAKAMSSLVTAALFFSMGDGRHTKWPTTEWGDSSAGSANPDCYSNRENKLDAKNRRYLAGEDDQYIAGTPRRNLNALKGLSGYDCADYSDCLQIDGSGYFLVSKEFYHDSSCKQAPHYFFQEHYALKDGHIPVCQFLGKGRWMLEANMEWLAQRSQFAYTEVAAYTMPLYPKKIELKCALCPAAEEDLFFRTIAKIIVMVTYGVIALIAVLGIVAKKLRSRRFSKLIGNSGLPPIPFHNHEIPVMQVAAAQGATTSSQARLVDRREVPEPQTLEGQKRVSFNGGPDEVRAYPDPELSEQMRLQLQQQQEIKDQLAKQTEMQEKLQTQQAEELEKQQREIQEKLKQQQEAEEERQKKMQEEMKKQEELQAQMREQQKKLQEQQEEALKAAQAAAAAKAQAEALAEAAEEKEQAYEPSTATVYFGNDEDGASSGGLQGSFNLAGGNADAGNMFGSMGGQVVVDPGGFGSAAGGGFAPDAGFGFGNADQGTSRGSVAIGQGMPGSMMGGFGNVSPRDFGSPGDASFGTPLDEGQQIVRTMMQIFAPDGSSRSAGLDFAKDWSVKSVEAGGQAAELGIQVGWQMLEFNKVPVEKGFKLKTVKRALIESGANEYEIVWNPARPGTT